MSTGELPVTFAILAADALIFTIRDAQLFVRITHVHRPPEFPNTKAFPGGLLKPHENGLDTALRVAHAKAHINTANVYFEQLYTFSDLKRDKRGRVVSIAYIGLVPWDHLSPTEQADDDTAWWAPVSRAKKLAYDHDDMLMMAITRLRSRIQYTTVIAKIMPKEFTLTELENAYEIVLGHDLDKRNFRKKILKLNIVKTVPRKRSGGRFRPAQLYTFVSKEVKDIEVL